MTGTQPKRQKDTVSPRTQAHLQRHGLLAEAHELWASPCGGFALLPTKTEQKRRRRAPLR